MTIRGFGKVTPVQGTMMVFAGHGMKATESDDTCRERLRSSHDRLVSLAGRDLGYDPGP